MAIRRHTDILGGVVGGLPPLIPFAGWRVYNVTDVYTDPEGLEYPVFRIVKASGPLTDTIAQIQARAQSYFVEKKWGFGGGALSGQYPGLAWYLLNPTTMAAVAGPLLPIGNVALGNLDQDTRTKTPITNHVLQWFEHSTPTGPYIAVLVAREPTTDLPLFVSGHPVDIATDLLTEKGESYDSASALSCRNSLGPELGVTLPITAGDESPQDVIDRLSEAFGFTLRHGESGSVEFIHWRQKLNGLPAIVLDTDSIRAEGGPTFDLSDSSRVNRVKVSGQLLSKWLPGQVQEPKISIGWRFNIIPYAKTTWKTRVDPLATDKPASGLVISSGDITFDYSTDGSTPDSDTYGAHELEIDLGGMPGFIGSGGAVYPTNLEQFAEGVARHALDGHARGRQMLTAVGIRGTAFDSALLGEKVTVDFDHLPNAQLGQTPTSQRGGQRPFRVIERTEQIPGPVVTMVDEGTGVQFGTTPSLVLVIDAFEPDLLLVSVSDAATLAAAGAQVEFQVRVFAFGDPIDVTDPGVSYTVRDSTLWTDDPQSLRLGPFPLHHTVLLRVRAWLYGGAASDWSPWTGLGGEITGPTSSISDLVVNSTTDEGAVISWSYDESPPVGSVKVQYRLHGGGGYTTFSTLTAGTETETIDGLAADTWYDVRVVLDNGGEYGAVLLGTFQTLIGGISSLTLGTPTASGVDLSWTNTHPTAYVRVQYKLDTATEYQFYQLLAPGSVQLTLTGLTAGTAYDVRVQLVDLSAGTEIGTPLDDSFTTASSGSMVTLTAPSSPTGFGGVDPAGANSPGTYGLEVTAVFGPPHMTIVFEVATETSVGSNTPGSYTAQAPMPAVVGADTVFSATAPNDNLKRYLRAKAVAVGFTDSSYTAVVAVDPWPDVPVIGGPALASPDVGLLRLIGYAPEVSTVAGGSYTDEQAQDAVGAILTDTTEINFTYNDATPSITADLIDNTIVAARLTVTATSRLLGRKTAGAGAGEELTLSEVLDFIGSAAQGDILYRGASAWARLAAGTSGKFLQTQGASANPQWATPSSGPGGSVDPLEYTRRMWWHQANAVAASFDTVMLPSTITGVGTSATDNLSGQFFLRITSGAVSGNAASLIPTSLGWYTTTGDGVWVYRFATKDAGDLTSVRFWAGLFSASPIASDDPTAHIAAFRFSTGASDTQFMACTKDNTTLSATATGITPAADTIYLFRVEWDGSEVRFYINGSLVHTSTSNLPGANTAPIVSWTTLTAAGKAFRYGRQWGSFLG